MIKLALALLGLLCIAACTPGYTIHLQGEYKEEAIDNLKRFLKERGFTEFACEQRRTQTGASEVESYVKEDIVFAKEVVANANYVYVQLIYDKDKKNISVNIYNNHIGRHPVVKEYLVKAADDIQKIIEETTSGGKVIRSEDETSLPF